MRYQKICFDFLNFVISNENVCSSYPVHSDLATWKSSLLESFPKEKSGIDQFFKMVSGTSPRTLLVQYLLKRMPLTLVDWLASLGLFTLMGGDLVSGSAKLSTAASVSKMTKVCTISFRSSC